MQIKSYLLSKTGMKTFFAGLILVFVFAPLINRSVAAPFWFQEHFFNTLKIAQNFKALGFPTFDGITPTNDLSVVWTAVLIGLSYIAPFQSTAFFILVRAVLGIALGLSLFLLNKLTEALNFKPTAEVRFLILSFFSALFLYNGLTGSDAALVIPCLFLNALCLLNALQLPRFKTAVGYGLSLLLCVLVRFDALGFALTTVLIFYFQFNKKNPISTKQLITLIPGIIVGLIPLMIWADILQTLFKTPMPTGVLSWAQTQDHAPWRMLILLFVEPVRYIAQIPAAVALLTFPALLLGLTAYASFPWVQRDQTPKDTVFYALIWYPILYLMVLSAFTYIAVPEYAFYPLAVGSPIALLFAACRIDRQLKEKQKEQNQARLVWMILGCCFALLTLFQSVKPRSAFYQPITRVISEFTDKNQGVYAMSAGAGISAFMTQSRFVRLDGMAQDKQMLDFLASQTSLDKVLKHYDVDYFIAVNPQAGEQECYSAREPVQNRFGGSNKGMSDWLCAPPVFEKQATPKIKIGIFKINQDGKAVAE